MIKTNEWRPDTCKCRFTFQWDTTLPAKDRIHFNKKSHKTCPDHLGIIDEVALYDVVLSENTRKNITLKELRTYDELTKEYTVDVSDEGEAPKLETRRGFILKINWFFTGSDDTRVLNVDLSSTTLTAQKKSQIQNFADSRFGLGKVLYLD